MPDVRMVAALCVAAMATSARPSTGAQAASPSAIAGPVTGGAEILNAGASGWLPLVQGAHVLAGSQIRCLGGASAALELPDQSSVLVAENTRYVLTALDSLLGSGDVLSHLVVGKVIARTVGVEQVAGRPPSRLIISTPTGLVVVTGRGVVVAYNPAAQRSFVAGVPVSGAGPTESAAIWVPFASATPEVVEPGTFVTQNAGETPAAPAPISTLPPRDQQQLTAAGNSETAGSALLAREIVIIVGPRTVQQVLTIWAPGLARGSATRPEASSARQPERGPTEMATDGSPCGSPPCAPTPRASGPSAGGGGMSGGSGR